MWYAIDDMHQKKERCQSPCWQALASCKGVGKYVSYNVSVFYGYSITLWEKEIMRML